MAFDISYQQSEKFKPKLMAAGTRSDSDFEGDPTLNFR
jgi:hypothetical protein